jgi:steroid delta-isomerase-like uncharacterized protein
MSGIAPTPGTSQQPLIDAAMSPLIAYGDKNWDAVKAAVRPGFLYDEVATQRKTQGVDSAIACWQQWAEAFPDSRATFHTAVASGNTVLLEITWRGTHTGTLDLPGSPLAATNRTIDVRACQVIEMVDGKPQSIRHYFDMATMLRQLGVER